MFAAEFGFMNSDRRDISLLQPAFHPDVVVHEPPTLPYAGDWRGLDGIAALIGKMSEVWSDMAVEDLCAVRDGDIVHLHCSLRLTSRESRGVVTQPFAEVLRFEDGRLREGRPFYFDTAELLQVIAKPS
jgi:ketosteroid isomerase-like protein